jgi:lipopolysaccharide export system protein LptA
MTRTALAVALLLGAAPALAPAQAQEINLSGNGPIEITARDAIELRQNDQVVIARGAARAVRGGVTVVADRLVARYRPRTGAPPPTAQPSSDPLSGSGANELWRLEAEGNVRITTATDTATADRAVYDMDQAVLVLTGRNLSLFNAQDKVTARDALEYWPQRRMAVARGDAKAESPGRRINADTLVAWFLEAAPPPAAPPAAAAPPARTAQSGQPDTGRLDRVEGFSNVVIRTETETVQGDRGVYSAATGIALLGGNVRITRGQNQLNGQLAEVNMRTGVSRLLSEPGARVTGLVVPQGNGPDALPLGPQSQQRRP